MPVIVKFAVPFNSRNAKEGSLGGSPPDPVAQPDDSPAGTASVASCEGGGRCSRGGGSPGVTVRGSGCRRSPPPGCVPWPETAATGSYAAQFQLAFAGQALRPLVAGLEAAIPEGVAWAWRLPCTAAAPSGRGCSTWPLPGRACS